MKSLLRTKVDRFVVQDAYTLSELQELSMQPKEEWHFLQSVDSVFQKYEAVMAKSEAQKLIVNGNRIPIELISENIVPLNGLRQEAHRTERDKFIAVSMSSTKDFILEEESNSIQEKKHENVRLYDANGCFIGIYTYIEATNEYKPIKLFGI